MLGRHACGRGVRVSSELMFMPADTCWAGARMGGACMRGVIAYKVDVHVCAHVLGRRVWGGARLRSVPACQAGGHAGPTTV
eukprot:366457-Chlamydomonas_euryale.AAC.9